MNEILKHVKSVCPDCKCKGTVVNSNGNINLCERCEGKGYQTYQELEDETKKLGETQRQEKKKK